MCQINKYGGEDYIRKYLEKMLLSFLFLFAFSTFTANIAGADVTAGGKEKPKPVFSRFIGPEDCPGVRHNADPYVLKEGDAWYITCTYGARRAKYMFKTTDWVSKKRYSLDIDFNNDYLRRHFNNAKVTGSAIWGFVPYKHTDGSWHGYGSIAVGKFKTVICHFSPVGDGSWPVTRWKMDKVLVGGMSSQTYETKVYSDGGGSYLIYVDNLDDGNNHIMAQKLVGPDEIDTSFKARAILSPEGLNSEYRNDPNGMQICEGMNISHVSSGGGSKYLMF